MSRPGVAALGDVAEFIRGITFKPDDVVPSGTAGAVRCMRTKNVQAEIDLSDVWSVDSSFVKRANQYLQGGDLLVSSANSWNLVGKCCWVPEEVSGSTFGGFISVLRSNRDRIDPRYLYYWFSSDRVQTAVRSFGRQTTNISNLDFARCLSLSIPLPALDRQRWIVQVLDNVEVLRTKRRQSSALLDDLAQSIFVEMFGDPAQNPMSWPVVTLGEIASEFRYGTSNKSGDDGYPVLRIPNVLGGSLGVSELKTVQVSAAEFERLRLIDGDLLFVRTNGNPDYVGRCAVFTREAVAKSEFSPDFFIYASYLIRARLREDVSHPVYVREFLRGPVGRRALRKQSKTSAGQFNINTQGLDGIRLVMPPLRLQEEFAQRVAQVEQLKDIHSAHLVELDALFASLRHRAFYGELGEMLAT